ncbi:MAG: hypothetical protein IJB46_02425 [Prevotella sp.]|nr:hypothetical protein [Prevotella sp.]
MRKNLILILSAVAVMSTMSCSSKLDALSADNFNVTPNPLESRGGVVAFTVDGTFPEKYMKKKAQVTVTPQLRYNGETLNLASQTFQGEKVLGNGQTISYKVGGKYSMKSSTAYKPEMQKTDLYLVFDAKVGKKTVEVPAVKVATGILATSELYKKTLAGSGACFAVDTFQRVRAQRQEAQIKFLINQANLRKGELKNNSVTEFVEMLKRINREQETLNIKDIEVLAYASPDGGLEFNEKLANKRQDVSEKYVKEQLKKTKVSTDVTSKYTAQDWEGFQRLVAASNIQDKNVILRVLSMYKDPEEREQQIRNMSAGFQELANGILPELRRSRLVLNYDVIGRSDEQIKAQYADDASKLTVDELLYAATLENNADVKEAIYKKTTEIYPNDFRAFNNVAAIAFAKGNNAEASDYLKKALNISGNAAEANANAGMLALLDGDQDKAQNLIAKATGANGLSKALGALNLAKGNYAQAEADFKGVSSNTAALAQIMNKNYAGAITTLNSIESKDALTSYLMAIVCARQGKNSDAASYLQSALKQDESLKAYAENDLEFVNIK